MFIKIRVTPEQATAAMAEWVRERDYYDSPIGTRYMPVHPRGNAPADIARWEALHGIVKMGGYTQIHRGCGMVIPPAPMGAGTVG
jgi:hypothetical protein